ncbi:MAG: hypothetical protein ACK5L3_14615 [Oscillospiraceae bacterium]
MRKSLRAQGKTMLQYTGISIAALFVCIPYSILMGAADFRLLMARLMFFIILGIFLLVFPQSYYATCTSMALSFGATRRGWFAASLVVRPLFAVLCSAAALFVADPLAGDVFGEAGLLPPEGMLLVFCAGIFCTSLGTLLGMVNIEYGIKKTFLLLLGLVLAGGIAAVVLITTVGISFYISAGGICLLAVLLAALCLPFEVVNWRILRHMEVKV